MTDYDQLNQDMARLHGARVRHWLEDGRGPVPGSLDWQRHFGWKPYLTKEWERNHGGTKQG